jgi:hypothetical protein
MAALAKHVWVVSSYGGEPSVEVFTKNYCLHWQKKEDRWLDCLVWILHLHAEDWKDFG